MTKHFNFRHVAERLGIPSTNKNNWKLGQMVCRIAADMGVEPDRILTEKTNPSPSDAAPHCIGHYPLAIFDAVCEQVESAFEDEESQQQFNFSDDTD